METKFNVKGFHCNSCEMLVKDIAEDFPEITSCNVNIKTGRVILEHEDGFDVKKFKDEIEEIGDYIVL